jgi:hypothetical protein
MKCDILVSNFAFKFSLHRYSPVQSVAIDMVRIAKEGLTRRKVRVVQVEFSWPID